MCSKVDAKIFSKGRKYLSSLQIKANSLYGAPFFRRAWKVHFSQKKEQLLRLSCDQSVLCVPVYRKFKFPFRSFEAVSGEEIYHGSYFFNDKNEEMCGNIIAEYLWQSKKWDSLVLHRFPEKVVNVILERAEAFRPLINHRSVSTVIKKNSLPFDEYLKRYGNARKQKDIPAYFRRAGRSNMRFEDLYDPAVISQKLPLLEAVSNKCWKVQDNTHLWAGNRVANFYRTLFEYGLSENVASLHLLLHDDRPIAFVIVFYYDEVAYVMKVEFDEDFKKYSPGIMIMHHAIQTLYNDPQVTKIDFVSDVSFLNAWTTECDRYVTLSLFNKTKRGSIIFVFHKYIFQTLLTAKKKVIQFFKRKREKN